MASPCLLNQATKDDLDKIATPETVSMFWHYAKANGLFKGLTPEETRSMMADRFNLPERHVAYILNKNKTVRKASDSVRERQKITGNFLASNRRWLANFDQTKTQKLINFAFGGTRRTLLAYHGPVPPVTHALDVLPTNPVEFVKMYFRGFRALLPSQHAAVMTDLEKQPYFDTFRNAGAPIGRDDIGMEGFPKKGWAPRAMDAALKPLRYNMMRAWWERDIRAGRATPEMARFNAIQAAHATGSMVRGEKFEVATRGMRQVALAPQLTISKWAKTVGDPLETIGTLTRLAESKFSNTRPPSVEERTAAFRRIRRGATYLGVVLGALKANQAILQATNSNQKVNMDNPIKGDFLAYKFAGHSWRMRGSIEVLALLARIIELGRQTYKFGQSSPEEAFAKYGEYKLAPGFSLGAQLAFGKDPFGRPVPWSKDLGSKRFPRQNYMEFIGEHGPIFVGHAISAFHEALRDQGVDTRDSMNVIRSISRNPTAARKAFEESLMSGSAEFFGVNIQPDRYMGK